jgi:hypothetical protein
MDFIGYLTGITKSGGLIGLLDFIGYPIGESTIEQHLIILKNSIPSDIIIATDGE